MSIFQRSHSEVLKQFDKEGLSINEGIAVDARLVKSASRPMSNDDIKKHRDKRNSPEGKLDKNGNPLKYHRDLESDWTVKNDVPYYGLKEHASVDVNNGFVLATMMTPASHHDSPYLPWCAIYMVFIRIRALKRFTRIKATLGSRIAIFLPLIKLRTAS